VTQRSPLSFHGQPSLSFSCSPPPEDYKYDDRLARTNLLEPEHEPQGDDDDDPLWFKQTINNACGLYAILHAITNGQAKDLILQSHSLVIGHWSLITLGIISLTHRLAIHRTGPDSHLCRLLEQCARLPSSDRATVLEYDEKLESIYRSAAVLGDTEAPQPRGPGGLSLRLFCEIEPGWCTVHDGPRSKWSCEAWPVSQR
jgi:hypothetical protein